MSRAILSENHQKSAVSFVCFAALAAKVGYTRDKGPDRDGDSIDATVRLDTYRRPNFNVQLKSTSHPDWRSSRLWSKPTRKNCDEFHIERLTSLSLVILELPTHPRAWLECADEEFVLRRCAWWQSLRGSPEIRSESKTVVFPNTQRLTPAANKLLMQLAGRDTL